MYRPVANLVLAAALATPLFAQPDDTVMGALTFREIGPVNMTGRLVDVAVVESNPYTFYLASATGGVWKTTTNGVTFTPVFRDEGTHSVGDVAVHQRDTNVVWVGTGERANRQSSSWGDGVYRSTDGGRTWRHRGLRDSHHIGRIVLHPDDSDIVYVAAMGHLWGPNEERGLYKTEDGGETWTRLIYVDEHTGVVDVAMDPSNPSILYAATYQRRRRPYGFHGGGPGSGLHKSEDGGRTWRELRNGLPEGDYGRIGISIYRSNPNIVYISLEQGWRYNASTAYGERRAGVYRSENKGESWQHMSDWNPRPMYASQPLVDPNDDQRIYMLNAFSYSDDGGRTFTAPRNRLHGDDRLVWVNPHDSRHVMKLDDGGLGISYDRARTWLYVDHLPISQFYRVSYDMRDPYWVYGGLQDNGSWAGPNATYRGEGILADDWIKTGGGDGFVNYPDTSDNRTLYTESQYLGLSRLDLVTRQRKWIRPDNARGAIAPRRNWDAWGPGIPEPELGNAMAPGNWDGPFIISPHDTRTLYAGLDQLWKSTDRGDNWISLGDLTTGVDRRELPIMGERAHDSTLSLDDGIPYYPTISVVAESPLERGVLYVGTDDGNIQVSRDDGGNWTEVSTGLPGLPESAWIMWLEPSRHAAGRVYAAANNYRNNDFANYLYRSDDYGQSWTPIVSDMPADRVIRIVREDLRNPNVLYVGTELGLFYTHDGGARWMALKNNLPTAAINDIALHPRDNDLILGTHGRGIWILDNITPLQEIGPAVASAPAHLFEVQDATMIRYGNDKGHTGDMFFQGDNPPAGAIVDFHLRERVTATDAVSLTVTDAGGGHVAEVPLPGGVRAGVNRVVWNLQHDPIRYVAANGRPATVPGRWVVPGEYVAQLRAGGETATRRFTVREDPRIDISDGERRRWHRVLVALGETIERNAPNVETINALARRLDSLPDDARTRLGAQADAVGEVRHQVNETHRRLTGVYRQVRAWPGTPTGDQLAQMRYLGEWVDRLTSRVERLRELRIETLGGVR